MSEHLKKLNNIRTLRAQARQISQPLLEIILDKISAVVNELREEREASGAANRVKADKVQKYRQMLIEDGIDPSELLQTQNIAGKSRHKRAPRPAKYQFRDRNGEKKQWTGQGRMPSALKVSVDNGHALEEFLI